LILYFEKPNTRPIPKVKIIHNDRPGKTIFSPTSDNPQIAGITAITADKTIAIPMLTIY
jgi:hypothetical protein